MKPKSILNLLNAGAAEKDLLTVRAEADGSLTLVIYEAIDDWYGVSARSVRDAVASYEGETIHVRLNSPGGDVFEGRAMMTTLAEHSARVVVHVDGLAASAAAVLALAADEVIIADGAFMMIHDGWSYLAGNSAELKERAALLDKVDASIVAAFAKRTGKDAEQIVAWMAAETWFSSAEALEHGFADTTTETVTTSASARFDLSGYSNTPKALAKADEPDAPKETWEDASRRLAFLSK